MLTAAELTAARERAAVLPELRKDRQRGDIWWDVYCRAAIMSAEDVPMLLAEVERLRGLVTWMCDQLEPLAS